MVHTGPHPALAPLSLSGLPVVEAEISLWDSRRQTLSRKRDLAKQVHRKKSLPASIMKRCICIHYPYKDVPCKKYGRVSHTKMILRQFSWHFVKSCLSFHLSVVLTAMPSDSESDSGADLSGDVQYVARLQLVGEDMWNNMPPELKEHQIEPCTVVGVRTNAWIKGECGTYSSKSEPFCRRRL